MKSITKTIFLVVLFAGFACDKIEAPYKEIGNTPGASETRRVLLEDYTDHNCVNCPSATKKAKEITQLYAGKVILLAIHAGYFANPGAPPFQTDYRTVAGTAWDQFFGMSALGNPIGMVNRKSSGGAYTVMSANWSSKVAEIVEDVANVNLSVSTTYNESNKKLDVNISSKFLQSLSGTFKLQVCIVEDSLVSAQKNNDPNAGATPVIENYVHPKVLRQAVNGNWGEAIGGPTGIVSTTVDYKNTYSLTLPANYLARRCSVIAFIYNDATKEILQVTEKKII